MTLVDRQRLLDLENENPAKRMAFHAIVLGAFWGACRLGNWAPNRSDSNAKKLVVCAADIRVDGSSDSLIVDLRYSKTNQTAERVHCIRLEPIPSPTLCPTRILTTLLDERAKREIPLTWPIARYGSRPHDVWSFHDVVAKHEDLGPQEASPLERALYLGHSFRRGFVALAMQAGIAPEVIRIHGDWKQSESVADYGRGTAVLINVTQHVFGITRRTTTETRASL